MFRILCAGTLDLVFYIISWGAAVAQCLMGVPTSQVGYTSAMPRREDHEVHKGHVVALEMYIYKVIEKDGRDLKPL